MNDNKKRCRWVGTDPLYLSYHDTEWGVPVYHDSLLFEFLLLEGAQAGLSWLTVLRKREHYRKAFAQFDPVKVAAFTEEDVTTLLQNTGIIRNQLKIRSAIKNAKHFLALQKEFTSFAAYQWQFVANKPIQNAWNDGSQVPVVTKEAETFSRDLKLRGFGFVGPTIMYSHMQAVGMVNDHTVDCFRYQQVKDLSIA